LGDCSLNTIISIQRNGLLVLSKVPGLLDHLQGFHRDEWHYYSVLEEDKGLLGVTDYPKRQRETSGCGTVGFRRHTFLTRLTTFAEKSGIPVHWEHKLETLEQDDESVTVTFVNGAKETFSFVVGCDGIHSDTRACLFGKQPATYTGVVEVQA
jgi:salicylate hydroxylase